MISWLGLVIAVVIVFALFGEKETSGAGGVTIRRPPKTRKPRLKPKGQGKRVKKGR